jgi:predicted anti-sigma-YlaC factor YlaD
MLDCKQVLAELSNYLDDEVAANVRQALEEHLAKCHRCSVIFDTTRQTLRIVCDAQPFDLPLDVSGRLQARLREFLAGR